MKKENVCISKSEEETKRIGKELAQSTKNLKTEKALVISLFGDLGGGKTTFTQGFGQGLNIREKILSPTFVIMKRFEIQESRFSNFYHIDCYRIKDEKDLSSLEFREILEDSRNIIIVEWAERIQKVLPKQRIDVSFSFVDEKTRKIVVESKDER